MVMDHQPLSKSYGTTTGLKFSNEIETDSKFADQNSASFALSPPNAIPSNITPTLSEKPEVNLHEDYDFSDVFLKHINQILLEEDMEEKDHVHQRSTTLEAAEKSFYELLGEKYPPSSDNGRPYVDQNHEISDEYQALNHSDSSCRASSNNFVIHGWDYDLVQYESSNNTQFTSDSIYSLLEGTCNIPEALFDSEFTLQFKRGFDEARKFLPKGDGQSNTFLVKEHESSDNSSCKIEEIEDEASSVPSIKKAQCKIK